nr:ketoacyl-ACP synthase III family protein [Actinomadura rayongensis]
MARSGVLGDDLDVHFHACGHEQGPEGWPAQHYILRHLTDKDVPSFRVWQACSGMIGAVELAASHLLASPERRAALVTGADNTGVPGFNRWALGLQNGVVGDAGSAVVLSTRSGFGRLLAINSGSTAEVEEQFRGPWPLFPPHRATPEDAVDLNARLAAAGGLDETLAEIVRRQTDLRIDLATRTVAEADLDLADITRVAHIFTGQETYLKTMLDPLGFSTAHGLLEFGRQFGHLTVNDQVVGLEHLVRTGQVGPGDHVLLLAQGGGVATTCAVVAIDENPGWRD